MIGTVRWFNPKKGYGFVQVEASSQLIYINRNNFCNNCCPMKLDAGTVLEFRTCHGERCMKAIDIRVLKR